MANFEKLMAKQTGLMTSISRVVTNVKKLGQAKMTVEVLTVRLDRLHAQFNEVRDLDAELQVAAGEHHRKHQYFSEQQFDRCEQFYEDSVDYFMEALAKLSPRSSTIGSASIAPVSKPASKLPRLELPNFDGTFSRWETFRDRFKSMVINDPSLSNVERMHYLCSALSGEARDDLNHLAITEDNFAIAWRIISSRYENKQRLLNSHLTALFDLSPISAETSKELKSLRDSTNIAVHALKNLGRPVDYWDDIFVFRVATKLDPVSRKEWEIQLSNQSEFPTYADLERFLDSRIRALEAIVPVTSGVMRAPLAKPPKPKKIVSHSAVAGSLACAICKSPHPLYKCSQFLAYSAFRRHEFIKTHRRCFNCFAANHSSRDCPSQFRCRECKQRHHTLLHNGDKHTLPTESSSLAAPGVKINTPEELPSLSITNDTTYKKSVVLATARVRVYSQHGHFVTLRALLDIGSAVSIISERAAQWLRLPRSHTHVNLTGVGGSHSPRHYAMIKFGPIHSDTPILSTKAYIMKRLTPYAPSKRMTIRSDSFMNSLSLADTEPMSSDPLDVVFGADVYGNLMREGFRHGTNTEPYAQNTVFGWVIYGPIPESPTPSMMVSHHVAVHDDLDSSLRRFWELEDLPNREVLSPHDQSCEEHFRATHTRAADGRYIVRLPFQNGPPELGDSRSAALGSLTRSEKHLQRHPMKARCYSEFMDEYLSLGHMTPAPLPDNMTSHYYIPHHAVLRNHDETQLRVVFNASCRTSSGSSLNEHLLVGAKLQTDLGAILLRWRQFRYVMSADVAKMYRQILVHPLDTKYQLILWRSSPSMPVETYQLLTVTYGTTCAPFLALRVLQQLASDEGARFPLACTVLRNQTYVDDCIFGADDKESALNIRDQLITLLAKGGFQLRKWASNCSELLTNIDPSDYVVSNCKVLEQDSLKILGICWLPDRDIFTFKVDSSMSPATSKRMVLSVISRLFDPLGWVTPVTISAKIMLQDLWLLKSGWDDELPFDLMSKWQTFQGQLEALETLEIPRWTNYLTNVTHVELHGFADASQKAYAAVVYLRLSFPDGRVESSLIAAKSKVSPVKVTTIPRLELCAALLLARLLTFVRSSLSFASIKCTCWTDSTVTLAWITQHPAKWKVFVANRVSKIQELLPSVTWKYVSTHDNPADCASRGLSPSALLSHHLWWSGPEWLNSDPNQWPDACLDSTLARWPEERVVPVCNIIPQTHTWNLASRYSSWSKLLRITAYIQRFVHRLRSPEHAQTDPAVARAIISPTAAEIRRAKIFWYKYIQMEVFPEERLCLARASAVKKSSSLASLNPYIDPDGLIRVRGRLTHAGVPEDEKFPIIVKSHFILALIIADTHIKALHAGPRLTLALLRQDLWILRAKTTVRSVLYRCVACTRERAKVPNQLMGDLPDFRVNPAVKAFVHVGVDYAGPLLVRTAPGRGYKAHKAYIALFICMTTKAVHLELVSDYTSATFVAAYQRFTSRRGLPTDIYSDNGTTFQGAERDMTAAFQASVNGSKFQNHIATNGTEWHFIPPAAPHFGGLWEAAIKSVKSHLKRTIGAHTLTFEEMTTLLCRVESWINSRPLGPVSDNLDDYNALTPGHFLTGSSLVAMPEPSLLDVSEHRLSRWQLVQSISERVWKAWASDYVHTLQQRPKWRTSQNLAKLGTIVIVHDPCAPPSRWKLGRIIECHSGSDGLIRVVTVKTADSEYKRPLAKLCFLPIDINTEDSKNSSTAGGIIN